MWFQNVFVALPCWRAAKNYAAPATTYSRNGLSPYRAMLDASQNVGIFGARMPLPILRNVT